MVKITEIFHSIQGESTYAGRPCVFVRLTGCPLRCTWCDTAYAFYGGRDMTIDDIVNHTVGRALDLFGIETGLVKRWGETPRPKRPVRKR